MTISCRARVSDGCLNGLPETAEGPEYRMEEDGTYSRQLGGTVVCTPCYAQLGSPANEYLGAAMLEARGVAIIAEPVGAYELQPGELFSVAGPDYWSTLESDAVGEKVYVRTAAVSDEPEVVLYRITIQR